MNETEIKRHICDYLKAKDVFFWVEQSGRIPGKHRPRYALTGKADILGIFDKRFLAIEVKVPGAKLRPEQDLFLSMVRACGGIGFVARSIEDVQETLGI